MRRVLPFILVCLVLVSCRTRPFSTPPAGVASGVHFFLEAVDSPAVANGAAPALLGDAPLSGEAVRLVTLPQSGVRIVVGREPVFTEADIAGVEIADRELGRGLVFQLKPAAAREWVDLSQREPRRRAVLMLEDAPIGIRRLHPGGSDGRVFLFVEVADSELPHLLARLTSRRGSARQVGRPKK